MTPRGRTPGTVLITGISGRFGRLLTRHLHRTHPVVGIDRRPFPEAPRDVVLHRADIRSRRAEDVFRTTPIETVIHLNVMHNPREMGAAAHRFNLVGTRHILELCERHGVHKLIVLSTANLYGASPDTMRYLAEDAPLLEGARSSLGRDLVELDMLCSSFFWQHPEVETVILRPVHLVGSVQNAPSNYLRLPKVPILMGFDPLVQVIHEDDVVQALRLTLTPGAKGVFNVAGPPAVPLRTLLALFGKRTVAVPHVVLEPLVKRMWRSGLWSFPPDQLDHLKFSCMVDDARIRRELGYTPTRSLEDIVTLLR
ncbi:MAG: NAD-dependent epimerase/dehydratase family protein [Myxococcales bacterium]|nr:NAD-dependent epimerase/dehydratase family protein [Myxococcales bacterium]